MRFILKFVDFLHTQVFYAVDEEHNGYLKRDDIKVAIVHLFGYKPSKVTTVRSRLIILRTCFQQCIEVQL